MEKKPVAGALEVAAVVVAAVAAWRITLGWDWSVVPVEGSPTSFQDPQSGLDYAVFGLAMAAGAGWLALRGRWLAGTAVLLIPIVLLTGWRMAAATVVGANLWPVGLAVFTVAVAMACAVGVGAGLLLRSR